MKLRKYTFLMSSRMSIEICLIEIRNFSERIVKNVDDFGNAL